MLHIAGIDQLKGPVGHAGVGRHIGIDVDVAQHVFLAGQIFLVHRQRQHDLHHLTGNAFGGLCAGIHQDQGVGVAGYDLDIRVGLFVRNRDPADAGILSVFVRRVSLNGAVIYHILCDLFRHSDGGQQGYCHQYADQQGQYPFYRFSFHCAFSSPVW